VLKDLLTFLFFSLLLPRSKTPDVTVDDPDLYGGANTDSFYVAEDFRDEVSEAVADRGEPSSKADDYDGIERALRALSRHDPDWSSMDPSAPYWKLFPEDDSASSASECGGGTAMGEDVESEAFASDDEASDVSDGDGSRGSGA
jgi:hypothetical protein